MYSIDEEKGIEKVAVLYGGWSHEANFTAHSVIAKTVSQKGIECVCFDVRHSNFLGRLATFAPDVVFPTNQGAYGEDGKLQGLLEILDFRYVGSGVAASAIGMNKLMTKYMLQALGVLAPRFAYVASNASPPPFRKVSSELKTPFIVKPILTGGSFGVAKVATQKEYVRALEVSARAKFGTCVQVVRHPAERRVTTGFGTEF